MAYPITISVDWLLVNRLTRAAKTSLLSAEFFNPNRVQFTYDLIFLGKLNEARDLELA